MKDKEQEEIVPHIHLFISPPIHYSNHYNPGCNPNFSTDKIALNRIVENTLFLESYLQSMFSPSEQLDYQSRECLIWYQFSLVAQFCPTLCNPMNCSMPGLPVHHQLLEFTQTRVHRVSDASQPSHPLSSPSPPASNPSQHQSLGL